jgi:DNA-binding transcriptional MerR regulator
MPLPKESDVHSPYSTLTFSDKATYLDWVRSQQNDRGRFKWGIPSVDVAQAVGITYRKLDYWERTALVMPSIDPGAGTGSRRFYSFEDMAQLALVKQSLDGGLELKHAIRPAMEYLQNDPTAMPVWQSEAVMWDPKIKHFKLIEELDLMDLSAQNMVARFGIMHQKNLIDLAAKTEELTNISTAVWRNSAQNL